MDPRIEEIKIILKRADLLPEPEDIVSQSQTNPEIFIIDLTGREHTRDLTIVAMTQADWAIYITTPNKVLVLNDFEAAYAAVHPAPD